MGVLRHDGSQPLQNKSFSHTITQWRDACHRKMDSPCAPSTAVTCGLLYSCQRDANAGIEVSDASLTLGGAGLKRPRHNCAALHIAQQSLDNQPHEEKAQLWVLIVQEIDL